MIKITDICKVFRTEEIETVALDNVSFEIEDGEFVAIMGPSGCGKSTLLNILGLLDNPTSGSYQLLGQEVAQLKEKERTKFRKGNIGFVFQSFNLIDELNVYENIELPLRYMNFSAAERKEKVEAVMARMNISHRAKHFPQQLSGGQQQRVAIARAVVASPKLILADEPTGNLDVKASKEVAALLKAVSKDKLVIVVTHNPEFFVEYATRRVTIFDGSVKEDKVIRKPLPKTSADKEEIKAGKWQDFKNTMHIGTLNYKSRPKFTAMMSFALFVCAITLFLVISVFGNSLIRSTQVPLDGTGVTGKVILSNRSNSITQSDLDEVAGQKHLLGEGALLRRLIENGTDTNLIFYGPSGTGKTTVANIIAKQAKKTLYYLNATTASLQDVKNVIGDVGTMLAPNGVLLYLDEIQYFNKKQQQTLLEYIENGKITLIASTTENPYFYVFNAILSRSTVFEFKQISKEASLKAVKRAVCFMEDRTELIEGPFGLLGDDVGYGGLSRAAGAVENHVWNVAGVNQAAQHRALAQNMFLSKYFVQRLWPKQIR